MDVGQFLGMVVGAYFFVLGAFAAWTVMRALSDGDGARLAGRVYLTLTKTTFFVGFPALLGALLLLNAEASGDGHSGIMSRGMGLTVLFAIGALGLLGAWVSAITLGLVGSLVVKNLAPLPAALVMFGFVSGAPVLFALTTALQAFAH
jgi:hypothetical protein